MRWLLVFATLLWTAGTVRAIDNPDAPDFAGSFEARAQPYEERLSDVGGSGSSTICAAARAYARFLDVEMDKAYEQLLGKLDAKSRRALVRSQRQWRRYLDAETRFINQNWTPRSFGSSSILSRADYSTRLAKQRVVLLLNYLRNYPEGER